MKTQNESGEKHIRQENIRRLKNVYLKQQKLMQECRRNSQNQWISWFLSWFNKNEIIRKVTILCYADHAVLVAENKDKSIEYEDIH